MTMYNQNDFQKAVDKIDKKYQGVYNKTAARLERMRQKWSRMDEKIRPIREEVLMLEGDLTAIREEGEQKVREVRKALYNRAVKRSRVRKDPAQCENLLPCPGKSKHPMRFGEYGPVKDVCDECRAALEAKGGWHVVEIKDT